MRGVAIVCAVAACGTDAPRSTPGLLSVTVRASGVPVADVPVWFQTRDGSLVLETTTTSAGDAAAIVEDGALVSVLTSYTTDGNPIPVLRTFVETRVGDELVIDEHAEDAAVRVIRVEVPADAGAIIYSVTTPCGHEDLDATRTVYLVGCNPDVAFVARSWTADYSPLGWIYVAPAEVANGATIDLRSRTWERHTTLPVSLTGFGTRKMARLDPSFVYERETIDLLGVLVPFVNGDARAELLRMDAGLPFALAVTLGVPLAAVYEHQLIAWGDSLDFDGSQLPPVQRPRLDLARRSVFWSEPTGADCVELFFHLTDMQGARYWRIVSPTDGSVVAIPSLPPALGEYAVREGVEIQIEGALIQSTAGYDALRAGLMNRRAHPYIAGPSGRTALTRFDSF